MKYKLQLVILCFCVSRSRTGSTRPCQTQLQVDLRDQKSLDDLENVISELNNMGKCISIDTYVAMDTPDSSTSTTSIWTTRLTESALECKRTSFTFTNDQHTDYVKYAGSIPMMTSFTACAWVNPISYDKPVKGTLFSYSAGNKCNSLFIIIGSSFNKVSVYTMSPTVHWTIAEPITKRSHVCFVLSGTTKKIHFYINGTQINPVKDMQRTIPGGGVLIIGQDQDGNCQSGKVGTPHEAGQGFRGKMQDVFLWDKALDQMDIRNLYNSDCHCPDDAIIIFNSTTSEEIGHAIRDNAEICYETSNT